MGHHRRPTVLLPLLLLPLPLIGATETAVAQAPSIRFAVVPRLGIMTASGDLYRIRNYRTSDDYRSARARLATSPVAGLTLDVAAEPYGVALRATLLRSVLAHAAATGFEGYDCGEGCILEAALIWGPPLVHEHDMDAVLLQGSVEATLDLRLGSDRARPYVLAGIAIKSYDFGDPEPADTLGFVFPESARGRAIQAGVGVRLQLLGHTLDIQVLDSYNSTSDERGLHDVFILAGVPLRLH